MPQSNKPHYTISVALCTYNGARYIGEQIRSILSQSRLPDEIVVSDDGSADGTPDMAEALLSAADIRYRVLRSGSNQGVISNFSTALRACTGELILPCDQDDVWLEHKIAALERVFADDADCILAFSDACLTDAALVPDGRRLWQSLNFSPSLIGPGRAYPDLFTLLLNRCVVTGTAMAFRRGLLELALPLSANWIHDGWLAILAACTGKICPVNECLLLYRQHGGNVVGANDNRLLVRSKRYLDNFARIRGLRLMRRDRYQDALDRLLPLISGSAYDAGLRDCIAFWQRKLSLDDAGFFKGMGVIAEDLKNTGYARYYNGFKGAARDMVCLLHKQKDEKAL